MALADFARRLEDGTNRRNTVRLRDRGWEPRLTGYMGWGSVHAAKVLARATMANPKDAEAFSLPFLPSSMHTLPSSMHTLPSSMHTLPSRSMRDIAQMANENAEKAQRGWRQFFTTQVGFLPVTVTLGKQTISTRTDRSGYIDLLIEDHGLEPGWHEATLTPAAGEPITAPIMIVADNVTTGLISDIDDTIVVTWLPRAMLAAYNSFVLHTDRRQPVPGMADFYRTLLDSAPDAPVFYLSTGAWNVYSTMLHFIQHNDLPIGPMVLTDWGPTPTGMFRSGQEHKRTQLRNLLIMFPSIEWYLIGDDGQHDPMIYDELAREFPQRVRGIALRTLNLVEQVLSHGTPEAASGNREDSDIEKVGVPIIRGEDGFELLAQAERFL